MAIVPKNRLRLVTPAAAAPTNRPDIQPRSRVRRPVTPPAAAPIDRPYIQARARVRRPAAPTPTPRPAPAAAPIAPPAEPEATYDIGYKKPPVITQFKKGHSGNKKGRPKGAKGLKTIARELLSEKVTVRTAGGLKRMRKIEAMVHKVMEKAFSGDMRAIQSLLQLYASSVPDEPLLTAVLADVPALHSDAHDEAILAALKQTLRDSEDDS